ncbi:MAG TPA: hypothetical protein VMV95_00405 [Bacillota bacterium]|nr:hypothetical protein [Bacillota bacterium]
MPIEKEIKDAAKELQFFKNLPEFINRAKYLKGKLKPGETLSFGTDGLRNFNYSAEFIYLEIHKKEGKPERPLSIDCLGDIHLDHYLFEDYKPLPESQRG